MKEKYVHTRIHKFGSLIQKKWSYLSLSMPLKMQLMTGNQLIAMPMQIDHLKNTFETSVSCNLLYMTQYNSVDHFCSILNFSV